MMGSPYEARRCPPTSHEHTEISLRLPGHASSTGASRTSWPSA